MATLLQVHVTQLNDAAELEGVLQRPGRLQVLEVFTEWAGPTQATKTAWRKLLLEQGGAPLPFDISTACLERCAGAELLAGVAPTSEPTFLLFKQGKMVQSVSGVDLPTLVKAALKHSAEGPAVARQESEG